MAIVINEFEAVVDAPVQRSAGQSPAAGDGTGAPGKPEPQETAQVLHELAQCALRAWAH